MANINRLTLRNCCNVLRYCKQTVSLTEWMRPICTSQNLSKEELNKGKKEGVGKYEDRIEKKEGKYENKVEKREAVMEGRETTDDIPAKKGWFGKLLNVRTIEPSKESHASKLSSKDLLYEVMFHSVKPECMEEYLQQFSLYQKMMQEKQIGAVLRGSFTVEIGNQDEAVHIWEYPGYPDLNEATKLYRTDKDFIEFRRARNKMLNSRRNQIMLKFSYWPEITARSGPNIYEMRTYSLKPGTMIEWANNWARGLTFRKDSNPVAGMFSQIGHLHQVHHLWSYENLQMRKETRENTWQKPGWDEVVQYTVPLIQTMQSMILIPTPFSPLQ